MYLCVVCGEVNWQKCLISGEHKGDKGMESQTQRLHFPLCPRFTQLCPSFEIQAVLLRFSKAWSNIMKFIFKDILEAKFSIILKFITLKL